MAMLDNSGINKKTFGIGIQIWSMCAFYKGNCFGVYVSTTSLSLLIRVWLAVIQTSSNPDRRFYERDV